MLERLYVTNYRCLVNFEFRPNSKQLLIGGNGSGKTTVLDVLALLRDFAETEDETVLPESKGFFAKMADYLSSKAD